MEAHNLYNLFLIAREKLIEEACRPQYRLRLLVGHANLVDVIRSSAKESPQCSIAAETSTSRSIDTPNSDDHVDKIMSTEPLAINVDMLALALIY